MQQTDLLLGMCTFCGGRGTIRRRRFLSAGFEVVPCNNPKCNAQLKSRMDARNTSGLPEPPAMRRDGEST